MMTADSNLAVALSWCHGLQHCDSAIPVSSSPLPLFSPPSVDSQVKCHDSSNMAPVISEDIAELCTIISDNTQKVADHLQQNRLPFPSFSAEAPTKSLIAPEASEVENARLIVIDATQRLQSLMLGPHDSLQNFTVSPYQPRVVGIHGFGN